MDIYPFSEQLFRTYRVVTRKCRHKISQAVKLLANACKKDALFRKGSFTNELSHYSSENL